jgi:hypothetical protein
VRARATLLLVTWVASVVLTVVHDDDGVASQERSAASTSSAAQRSAAAVRDAAHGPNLVARCGGAGGCHDPNHHHRPLAHHDVTQCPYCAMLLERPAELPLFVFETPAAVRFVGDEAPALLSSSQRGAFALARGPPPAGVPV